VTRTTRLRARFKIPVPIYQRHGYSDIDIFVGGVTLKKARASSPFCRGHHPLKWAASHQNGGFTAMLR
jgi:hypothetical protein